MARDSVHTINFGIQDVYFRTAMDGGVNKVQEFCDRQNFQVKNIQGGIFLIEHRIINCTFSESA